MLRANRARLLRGRDQGAYTVQEYETTMNSVDYLNLTPENVGDWLDRVERNNHLNPNTDYISLTLVFANPRGFEDITAQTRVYPVSESNELLAEFFESFENYRPVIAAAGGRATLRALFVKMKQKVPAPNNRTATRSQVQNPLPAPVPVQRHRYFLRPRIQMGAYSAAKSNHSTVLKKFLHDKRSVISIRGEDEWCFFKAIAALIVRAVMKQDKEVDANVMDHWTLLVKRCSDLHGWGRPADIATNTKRQLQLGELIWLNSKRSAVPVLMKDVPPVEDYLKCTIRIYDLVNALNLIYGLQDKPEKCSAELHLLLDGNHVHAVTSPKALFGKEYHCKHCNKNYNKKNGHRSCPFKCKDCGCEGCDAPALDYAGTLRCEECGFSFHTEKCKANHLFRCATYKYCSNCGIVILAGANPDWRTEHYCDVNHKCRHCMGVIEHNQRDKHKCFLQSKQPKRSPKTIIFFDFEATQCFDSVKGYQHVVSHAVASYSTSEELFEFKPKGTNNVLIDFCEWLFGMDHHKGYTVMAHYGKGYDFQFVQTYCLENDMKPKKMLRDGGKIKYMEVNGLRFIDSISFVAAPLKDFPKAFGLHELKKGYFPHLFNRPENWGYKGMFPPAECYSPDNMRSGDRKDFLAWYALQTGTFDFEKECMDYCKSDVLLLKQGMLAFQKEFERMTGIDPLAHITIASACLAAYRYQFMPENSIAMLSKKVADWIRRGFAGGRTNVMQCYAEADEHQRLRYLDVVSLYPSVNEAAEYPLGHPVFVESGEGFSLEMFGFAEVDVTPPLTLYHPVLGERKDGKFIFDLHPKKNMVVALVELQEAVRQGYVIDKVHAYCYWTHTTTSLFKDYVTCFKKAKEEASGWDGRVLQRTGEVLSKDSSPELKQAYCEEYAALPKGVQLSWERIEKNACTRQVAKICLNSLWGKLAQRDDCFQSMFCDYIDEKVLLLLKKNLVVSIVPIPLESSLFEVKHLTGDTNTTSATNIAVAAFTTAHARMVLYNGLKKVGQRAIYCDTDSIVFTQQRDEADLLETGTMFGMWSEEPDMVRLPIEKFVSIGTKTYAYRHAKDEKGKEKEVVKCKGVKLNHRTAPVLSLLNFVCAVHNGGNFEQLTEEFRIELKKMRLTSNHEFKKKLSITLDKGYRVGDRMYPFGYQL